MAAPTITAADVRKWGIAGSAFDDIDDKQLQDDCDQSWDEVEGYLRANGGIGLPLPADKVPLTLKQKACVLMSWNMMCVRGFDPTSSTDTVIRMRYEDALAWLEKVAAGKIQPIPFTADGNLDDATPDVEEGGAVVVSEDDRGWRDLLL